MAKFKYRMQNILDIKCKLEAQAKSHYSQANEKLRQEQLILDALYADIKGYEEQLRSLYQIRLDLKEVKRCKESIDIKKLYIKKQVLEVNKAKKNLELARLRLSEVMVERKTHEKLRDKEFEEYVKLINEKEMKEIDGLVSYSYNNVSR